MTPTDLKSRLKHLKELEGKINQSCTLDTVCPACEAKRERDRLLFDNAWLIQGMLEAIEVIENFTAPGNFVQVDTDVPASWTAGEVYISKLVDCPFHDARAFLEKLKRITGGTG